MPSAAPYIPSELDELSNVSISVSPLAGSVLKLDTDGFWKDSGQLFHLTPTGVSIGMGDHTASGEDPSTIENHVLRLAETFTNPASIGASYRALANLELTLNHAAAPDHNIFGLRVHVHTEGDGPYNAAGKAIYAVNADHHVHGNGVYGDLVGVIAPMHVEALSTAVVTKHSGFRTLPEVSGGTVTEYNHFHAPPNTEIGGTGVIQTHRGLYVETMDLGLSTDQWGVDIQSNRSHFGRPIFMGKKFSVADAWMETVNDGVSSPFPAVLMDVYHNSFVGGSFISRLAHGTLAAPADITANRLINAFVAWGWAGGAFRSVARVGLLSDVTPVGAACPGRVEIETSDSGGTLRDRIVADSLGNVIQYLPLAAPADSLLWNSSMCAWLDEATNTLTFKIKRSNGVVITKTL